MQFAAILAVCEVALSAETGLHIIINSETYHPVSKAVEELVQVASNQWLSGWEVVFTASKQYCGGQQRIFHTCQ
jgi:hypothetical protein